MRGRSREGAWIEITMAGIGLTLARGRSREGAWIEIGALLSSLRRILVAPARERGLKYPAIAQPQGLAVGRSREGAWIEIVQTRRSSEYYCVAPARERGLKYVTRQDFMGAPPKVAPARERGLKSLRQLGLDDRKPSLPRGSVD